MKKFFSNRWVEYSLLAFILVGAFSSIYAPKIPVFQESIRYAIHFMFLFLGSGMLFLILGRKKLMFASLACSAAICLFLKAASNENFLFPNAVSENYVDVAHINLSNVTDIDAFFEDMEALDPDVISFQELTPDWFMLLAQRLEDNYPYKNINVRMDPYGMGQYSKLPLNDQENIMFAGVPNLVSSINLGQKKVFLMDTYITQFTPNTEYNSADHLESISQWVEDIDAPVLSIGDFNMVYWDRDITRFRSAAKLKNSRIDFGRFDLQMPSDHIFYSTELECSAFQELFNKEGVHLGILGRYHVKNKSDKKDPSGDI